MIASLALFLLGSFLIAIALAWAVGPQRLFFGLVTVPIVTVLVAILAVAALIAYRLHGG